LYYQYRLLVNKVMCVRVIARRQSYLAVQSCSVRGRHWASTACIPIEFFVCCYAKRSVAQFHDVDRTDAQSPEWPPTSRWHRRDAVGNSATTALVQYGGKHADGERMLSRRDVTYSSHRHHARRGDRQRNRAKCRHVFARTINPHESPVYNFFPARVCRPHAIIADQSPYRPAGCRTGTTVADGPTDRASWVVGSSRAPRRRPSCLDDAVPIDK